MKTLAKLFILAALIFPLVAQAQETGNPNMVKRDFLMKEYAEPGVASAFRTGGEWFPYPAYDDREGWDRLFGEHKARFISLGESSLDYKWEHVPATAFLEFERSGDRTVMQSIDSRNITAFSNLMFAELAEGKGRFIDQIANGLWFYSQFTSWVLSAHQNSQKTHRALPDPRDCIIDLGSGRTAANLAMALHFFKDTIDRIDPSICYSAREAVRRNIEEPFLDDEKDEENWWLSIKLKNDGVVNNWDPWCNFNSLFCALLLQEDQEVLDRMVRKSLFSVDQFLNYVKEDGACEEGPAYWSSAGARLYEYLQLLYNATGGRFDIFDNRMVKDMGEYICRARIGGPYVVNFADAAVRLGIDSYMLWKYGSCVSSREMTDMALYGCAKDNLERFVDPFPKDAESPRTLENLRWHESFVHAVDSLNSIGAYASVKDGLLKTIPACTWYPQTEFCFLRTADNWFFAAKGGFNEESHNHNDVGTFTLFIDDTPVFVDAGVGIYTRQTFSMERYTIWSMQSDWHSLPLINGTSQINGREFKASDVAFASKGSKYMLSMDIKDAYTDAASCISWKRSFCVNDSSKGSSVILTDRYSLSKRILPDTENFLVKGKVLLPGDEFRGKKLQRGELIVECDGGVNVRMSFPPTMKAVVEVKMLDDAKMRSNWGESLCRISLVWPDDAPLRGEFKAVITRI